MARLLLVCLALFAVLAGAQNDAPVVLNGTASDISFTLVVSGVEMPQMNCQARSGALPSACLAEQGAVTYDNGDSVIVTYSPVTGVEGATSMELYACFSDIDAIGRPWRAPGSTYQENINKQCRYAIPMPEGDNLSGGSVMWKIPSVLPDSAMFFRAFVKCGDDFCATGQTESSNPYLWQAQKMNVTPPGLVAAVIICSCAGP
eukprot:CAMPEP_0168612246 /NCGR_PEP_ID=MMETSP0449_2-20121227/2806_1 /TAXON_ID=1082188 /ORGANISM="Strombidium rassoulzadegani, Strain ras09" /LENGTH=202 /DNA_ID=CAMNT_0008652781 /DNA_START=9 /DNA_END=614 /DNA_ORIENTATION=-